MEGLKRQETTRGWEEKDMGVIGEELEKQRLLESEDFKMHSIHVWKSQ